MADARPDGRRLRSNLKSATQEGNDPNAPSGTHRISAGRSGRGEARAWERLGTQACTVDATPQRHIPFYSCRLFSSSTSSLTLSQRNPIMKLLVKSA